MKDYLRLIKDGTAGKRCDVTPLFANPQAFARLLDDLIDRVTAADFEMIAAIDALGFILGTALAVRMGKGIVPIRKGGKMPCKTEATSFVDYSGQTKSLELRLDAVRAGTRMLVVDDWVETGAQVQAAIRLLEQRDGVVVGVASIHVDRNAALQLNQAGYRCFAVSDG